MATHTGLDKATVVQRAAQLADVVGLDDLSLKTVANALGIRTPTLYHYFPAGMESLSRDVALLSLREQVELLGQTVMGKAGDEAVRALADAYRSYIKTHPGCYAATIRPNVEDAERDALMGQLVTIALRALDAFHLAYDDAIHAVRMIRTAAHGMATLELAGGFGMPQEVDETYRRLITIILQCLAEQHEVR